MIAAEGFQFTPIERPRPVGESKPPNVSAEGFTLCLLYTSPSPRDRTSSRMPSSA